ncbi:flavin reductase [Leptolyngbya sp. FACHB-261]|nr:flavin reductase [Leptolyngbya sp. FACHB-261]
MAQPQQRNVQVLPIGIDTTVLRCRSLKRIKFEIEYALQHGTTANSYLIRSADGSLTLFDPPGETFTALFLEALQERIDLAQLRYLILGHVNPNRARTLEALLALAPQVKILCSGPAEQSLRELLRELPQLPEIQAVRGDEVLDLGEGHKLKFIPAPTPRWPDGLMTFDPRTRILYTDKFFGAHLCTDQVFDEGMTSFEVDLRYYFDCLMAPHAKRVTQILDRITPLEATTYATGHGPLSRYNLHELTNRYRGWLNEQNSRTTSVALLYASAYGSTATLAQAIAQGITRTGAAVEMINCEFADSEEIREAIARSAGFIIGSPTLGGHAPTPVQTALGIVLATAQKSQLAGVFGSFGWSGEAIDLLESKLQDAGFSFGFPPLRVKFKPTEVVLKTCEEIGTDFGQALRKTRKAKQGRKPATDTEQAVGRISNGLYVVTANRDGVRSAMLASWVVQASFSPPGLTIAVAKERAVGSLMYPGDRFVLNALADGNHIGLMKHFLKPFGPGEDRFAEIETQEATNGAPILKDSLSYLECTVTQMMECGDHWLLYCTADTGKVFDEKGRTAVHHRKSGSHY